MTLQEFFDTDYFKALMFESVCYRALERGGVDNWSWYGQSYEDYCNNLGADSLDEIADKEIRALKRTYTND